MRDPPPPFMENSILNFHFVFWNTSLSWRIYLGGNIHQSGSQLKSCVGKSSQRSKGGRPRKCGKQGGSMRLRWIGAVLLHPSSMPPPPPRTAAMAAISERNIGTERSGNMYFLKVKLISQNVLYRDQCDNTKILTEHIYMYIYVLTKFFIITVM